MAIAAAHRDPSTREQVPAELSNDRYAWIPVAIVIAAVVFNAVIAILNANVRPMTANAVILCEVAILGAAHAYVLARFDRPMLLWYAYIGFVLAFATMRVLATGTFEPKFVRDLLMIPTFVMLGMTMTLPRVVGCVLVLQAVVVAGIVLEAVSLRAFETLFMVKEYYINTRGMFSDDFTNEASGLFVSATRPDARFYPFFDLHRMSSIFLEPVSLGHFATIMVCFTVAFWPLLGMAARAFLIASIVLTMFASDGRAATMSAVLIILAAAFGRLLPRNIALVVLPLILAFTVAVVVAADFKTGTDDFQGRLAHTQHWLAMLEIQDYLGVSNRFLPEAEDSGIIYLIVTQSVLGVIAMWLLIVLGMPEDSSVHQRYKNGICLYIGLAMMISFSFVTIKTAAPLWMIYGFLAAATVRSVDDEAARAVTRGSRELGSKEP
jgi:putative polymerase